MSCTQAKAAQAALYAAHDAACRAADETATAIAARLGIAKHGAMNLTPDAIRLDPAYRAAKAAADAAFQRLRAFNADHVKRYKADIRAERRARLS